MSICHFRVGNASGLAVLLALGLGFSETLASESTIPTVVVFEETFDDQELGRLAAGWFTPMAGYTAKVTSADDDQAISIRRQPQANGKVGNLMTNIDVSEHLGATLKLTAKIKVRGDQRDRAQMWIRVDREGGGLGAFENMGRRPLLPAERPHTAEIEFKVDRDARNLAMGFLVTGDADVEIDNIRLEVVRQAAKLQSPTAPRTLGDQERVNVTAAARIVGMLHYFHAGPAADEIRSWDHVYLDAISAVEDAADDRQLLDRLNAFFTPWVPGLEFRLVEEVTAATRTSIAASSQPSDIRDPMERYWLHQGLDVSRARIAVATESRMVLNAYSSRLQTVGTRSRSDAVPPKQITKRIGDIEFDLPVRYKPTPDDQSYREALAGWTRPSIEQRPELNLRNRHTRMAAVALTWNLFQHFYPYFDVTDVDWMIELEPVLAAAADAETDAAFVAGLKRLVAKLDDGHVSVRHRTAGRIVPAPFSIRSCGEVWAIETVFGKGSPLRVGDVVVEIDGVAIDDYLRPLRESISAATPGWMNAQLPTALRTSFRNYPVELSIRRLVENQPGPGETQPEPGGEAVKFGEVQGVTVSAANNRDRTTALDAHDNGSEVADGIVYFNLRGTSLDELNKHMAKLVDAKGLIFDLRGYPDSAAVPVLRHLHDKPMQSAQWWIPISTLPDQQNRTWIDAPRWNLQPAKPRFDQPVAFLTDGSAISYAESVMGIVEHYRLGEIVGQTTAGTNGNINPFELPGNISISWTGMRVLKHDGGTHHGVGIRPTLEVVPSPQGLKKGTDEVLQAAIDLLSRSIAKNPR